MVNNFAEILKELRIERNLSQADVAKGVNVSQATIARWEAGKQIPNIDYLIKLVKFFDVTADYILGLKD